MKQHSKLLNNVQNWLLDSNIMHFLRMDTPAKWTGDEKSIFYREEGVDGLFGRQLWKMPLSACLQEQGLCALLSPPTANKQS